MYLLIHPSILIAAYPPKDQVQGWNFYHVDFSALVFSAENAVSIGLSYHSNICVDNFIIQITCGRKASKKSVLCFEGNYVL